MLLQFQTGSPQEDAEDLWPAETGAQGPRVSQFLRMFAKEIADYCIVSTFLLFLNQEPLVIMRLHNYLQVAIRNYYNAKVEVVGF